EALEETAYHFSPEWLLGVYRWRHPRKDITYLRFAFAGRVHGHEPQRQLDSGIQRAVWLSQEEIRATAERHRSPLVLQCVEDYLAGTRYPLELVTHFF
ncbi:MAG: NUDIX hydrolase, partial [Sulfuricella sp.]|nr:NUDIX hydrolase [Sulfuricella sp.]